MTATDANAEAIAAPRESDLSRGPKLLLALPYAEVRLDQTPSTAPGDPRPLGRQLRAATVGPIDVLPGLTGRGVHRLERDGAVRWRWTAGFGPIFVPLPEGYEPTDIRVDGQPVDAVRIVDLVNNAGSYLSSDGSGGDVGYEAPDGGDFDEPADRFAACGAAMVMPAHVIRAVGPMASNFFAYYEDTDWCWRAQLAGFRIRYEPAGLVRHVRWATSGGPSSEFASLLAARNRILTLVRNAPRERYHEEVAKALGSDEPPGIRRSLTRRLPVARLERARLGRRWVRSPVDVWERWAGVNDRWSEG